MIEKWAKRPLWVDYIMILLFSWTIALFWASRQAHPNFSMDAYYYSVNGMELAAGKGFQEPFIWQYLTDAAQLPAPAHTYWMPLPSLLSWFGLQFGSGFAGASWPFLFLIGFLPILTLNMNRLLDGERWQGVVGGLLTGTGGFYFYQAVQPESFAPFAWAAGGGLLLMGWAIKKRDIRYWVGAGLLAGLAHLSRADGLLVLLVGIGVWFIYGERRYSFLFSLLAGYLMTMGWWMGYSWSATGHLLPAGGMQTIFLPQYDDLFAYNRSFGMSDLLANGWGSFLGTRWEGIKFAFYNFLAVNGLVFLTPFIVLGGWDVWKRQRPLLFPVLLYTLLLHVAMSIVFTFPGMRGGLLHSSIGIWGWGMALVPFGVSVVVDWVAVRLPHWEPEKAKRRFSGMFVVVALIIGVVLGALRQNKDPMIEIYEGWAELLPADGVVMVGNPPMFYYHTGRMGVVIPNEEWVVVSEVMERYGATYLILDQHTPTPLRPIYQQQIVPAELQLIDQKMIELVDEDGIPLKLELYLYQIMK